MRVFRLFSLLILLVMAGSALATPQVQTLWRLLDYIAVDYPGAVSGGVVISQVEYDEMTEFSATVREGLAGLPAHPSRQALEAQAVTLQDAIADKAAPAEVELQARALAEALLSAYPVPRAPNGVPDLSGAAALYQQNCASCHGATGAGDGPAGASLDPPPIDFTDKARARQRSVFALQQVIDQGLEGTSMVSYAHLPEDQRWALAFYVGQLAFPGDAASRGEALLREHPEAQAAVPDLAALVHALPAGLAGLPQDEADDITAYLRREPQAALALVEAGQQEGALVLARTRLREGVEAYAAGDAAVARDKLLSAYLDGVEPIEPLLGTRDAGLLRELETAMASVRGSISQGAGVADVRASAAEAEALLNRAEATLDDNDSAGATTAFIGALTILLREGLEALLIVIAMVAFLRKAGRVEAMPYVHGGWIGALVAGGATWLAATYLVNISGASRELTEGFAALFAAVVLVSIGIWMHGKSHADAWQRYIREKLSHALSRGSAWFLFLLAFIVVYREAFETVLFYAALWSQGHHGAIMAGAATAMVGLAVVAWLMLRYSRKLPFGKFFAASAALVAVLAVVLAGKGVAALQEAGWVSMSLFDGPRMDLLGIHPTIQGVTAQLVVLVALLLGFAWNIRNARAAAAAR
ncbi:FTR1 family protein [Luteimonas sp. 22616]|uniref:FTR1 family protein n=1 Tax=Luteimonas sp. 22616 TaxID=3453951 RepID=UPI003F8635F4